MTTTASRRRNFEEETSKVKSTPSHRPSVYTPSIHIPSSSKQGVIEGKDLPHDAWAQSPGSREVSMSGYLTNVTKRESSMEAFEKRNQSHVTKTFLVQ